MTGPGAIGPWILSTVHRITEYPILQAWWIVGVWAVVACAGLADRRPGTVGPGDEAVVREDDSPATTPSIESVGVGG